LGPPSPRLKALAERHPCVSQGEAMVLTRGQAIALIARAGRTPSDFFSECGDEPLYRGATVFWWLRH